MYIFTYIIFIRLGAGTGRGEAGKGDKQRGWDRQRGGRGVGLKEGSEMTEGLGKGLGKGKGEGTDSGGKGRN